MVSYSEAWNLPQQLTQRRATLWGLVGNALIYFLVIPYFRIYGLADVVLEHLRGPNPGGPIDFNWHMPLLKRGFFLWLKVIVVSICWQYIAAVPLIPVVLVLSAAKLDPAQAVPLAVILYFLSLLPLAMVAMARLFRTNSLRSAFQIVPIVRFALAHYLEVLWAGILVGLLFLVVILGAYFTLGYFAGWGMLALLSLVAQVGRATDAEFGAAPPPAAAAPAR